MPVMTAPPTEQQEWTRLRATGDVEIRNRLVERHLPLVHHFAQRMRPRAEGLLETDDLVSAGTLGLLDAVSSFDPDRGFRFSTFAAARIRGAMLDEMRRRDVAPRSVRRKERRMQEAQDRLAVELDRLPRHPELARVLGVDPATLWRWKHDVVRSRRVSLTEILPQRHAWRSGRGGEGGLVDGPAGDAVEDRLTREAEVRRLRQEMEALSERERLILTMYDLEGRTLREIAAVLGVTESRISQLRTRALSRLRTRMKDLREAA